MGRSFFKKSIEQRRLDRCPRCEIRKPLCYCEHIPALRLDTRLVVVMHHAELNLTSNTARLATHALPNSEVRIRGYKHEPISPEGLTHPDRDTLLLYPSDDAVELTPEYAATLRRPVTLVVPDGSWRQARKAAQREAALLGLPRAKLPAGGPPSEYRLRIEPNEHSVCTFEAIARALGVIEGAEIQARLEALFRIAIGRALFSRGLLPAAEVPGGLPEGARPGLNPADRARTPR